MKTHGYMILILDKQLGYFKPINPKECMDFDPWFFSKVAAEDVILKLLVREISRPITERDTFIICSVKG